MSSLDNYGLPKSLGTSFLMKMISQNGNQGEKSIPLLCISGTGNHTSLPSPPPINLPIPQVSRPDKL